MTKIIRSVLIGALLSVSVSNVSASEEKKHVQTIQSSDLPADIQLKFKNSSSSWPISIDIVPTIDLNRGITDCARSMAQERYDLKSYRTIYHDVLIVCQLATAYIQYRTKNPYI